MFSGIVEDIGIIKKIVRKTNLVTFSIETKKVHRGTKIGDSIAIDGVCLTVTKIVKNVLNFDLMKETLSATTLGNKRVKSRVNLERALKATGRIHGHIVTGHIDTTSKLLQIIERDNYSELRLSLDARLRPFIVQKGSVCIDGISLTIGEVKRNWFSIYLIPLTKEVTTIGSRQKESYVNVEADILAKYVAGSR